VQAHSVPVRRAASVDSWRPAPALVLWLVLVLPCRARMAVMLLLWPVLVLWLAPAPA